MVEGSALLAMTAKEPTPPFRVSLQGEPSPLKGGNRRGEGIKNQKARTRFIQILAFLLTARQEKSGGL